MPNIEGAPSNLPPIQFASPPLPDSALLQECMNDNSSQGAFQRCVIGHALPKEYRITQDCLERYPNAEQAFICSTGRQDIAEAYNRFQAVRECADHAEDNYEIADCIGSQTLGQREQYYLGCITKNKGDLKTGAVCALTPTLTPEQQIALGCAIATGGEPTAFATCTGGQLFEREITKCWEHGIATEKGCFGPNNEYRKFLSRIDDQMGRTFGRNSVAYQAYQTWQNNVLAPGPNHEVIKFLNNGIGDMQHGPGPNNEFVKAGNAIGGAVQSVGKVFGF